MSAEVIVPMILENFVIGFIVLGERIEKGTYSAKLMNVLSVLGTQATLAVQSALYLQAETERVQQEGAAARRESLDVLVGTMAHEIDNPLTFVMGEADFLQEMLESKRYDIPQEDKALIAKSCGHIISGAQRVSNIIKAVEQYSKKQLSPMAPVFINQMLVPLQALLLLHKGKYPKVELIEDIQADLPPVWGQPVLIEEVILNLVRNGMHAALRQNPNGGGKLVLKISRQNDHVIIETTDNGYGIEPKILKQLFQVPTTTKGSTEGTGLGLYHVRRVVADMLKGTVRAESQGAGQGARFVVALPVYKGEIKEPAGSSQRVF